MHLRLIVFICFVSFGRQITSRSFGNASLLLGNLLISGLSSCLITLLHEIIKKTNYYNLNHVL
jgi:hypothetical protein